MRESDAYRRRSPEVLLQYIEQLKRGRFVILAAVASGAGKTTQLRQEGLAKSKSGLQVVWGTTPPADRDAAVLHAVPPFQWQLGDQLLEDLNVEELIKLMPDIVLVDGLAQPNRPESERRNRLDDVYCLIQHGISVIATMNAYEDERISVLAKRIAGMDTRWTIPGDVLKEADEVRLLDVTAESLLQRRKDLTEGASGTHRGKRRRLTAERSQITLLRELAFWTLADDVNGALELERHELGLQGPSGVTERIVVLAQYGWNGSIHIRRGDQIAKRLNGQLSIITCVPVLTERLGGSYHLQLYAPHLRFHSMTTRVTWAQEVVRLADQSRATQLITGVPVRKRRRRELGRMKRMLRLARHMDVLILTDVETAKSW